MSSGRLVFIGMLVVLSGWGCSKSAEPVDSTPPETSESASQNIGDSSVDSTAGDSTNLAGTTWEIGKYVLEFHEEPKVHISGEAVPIPGGIEGQYSVKDGAITVGAAGQAKSGTWDGAALIIEGRNAKRKSG